MSSTIIIPLFRSKDLVHLPPSLFLDSYFSPLPSLSLSLPPSPVIFTFNDRVYFLVSRPFPDLRVFSSFYVTEYVVRGDGEGDFFFRCLEILRRWEDKVEIWRALQNVTHLIARCIINHKCALIPFMLAFAAPSLSIFYFVLGQYLGPFASRAWFITATGLGHAMYYFRVLEVTRSIESALGVPFR